MRTKICKHSEQGAVLVFALIMLASITVMATAAVQTSVMELRLARNSEEMVNAFQTAQAAIDFTISDTGNLPMTGPLDTPTAVPLSGTPFAVDIGAGETFDASASRSLDCLMPPRVTVGASSMVEFSAFSFRIAADLDRSATGRGSSSIRQGYITLGKPC